MIAFLGTKDPLVPYDGGEIKALLGLAKRGKVVSADALIGFWAAHNGCDPEPVVVEVADRAPKDGSHIVLDAYAACDAGGDVDFYHVEGGGHTWPGGKQYMTHHLVGKTNRDVSASELMWAFFAAHPRP